MDLPVLTAVTGAVWESRLVTELDGGAHGVTVVRRCVDLADLLSAAAAGTARAVLLSHDLRRLDRDSVAGLHAAGMAVVGLVDPGTRALGGASASGDAQPEERLRQLGVRHVLAADAGAAAITEAVQRAVAELASEPDSPEYAATRPSAAFPHSDPGMPAITPDMFPPLGRVLAVWGPTGAPGRTTVAVGVADETSRLGIPTLLIDADVYGGVIAQVLGLLDESAGLAAACRQAGAGSLDINGLASLAWQVNPALRVLTGIARSDRWPELRPAALEFVLDTCRRLAPLTIVDCAFNIEQDEELAYDTAAPRRNGATLTILERADGVLCVSGADPVGVQRSVRALGELRDTLPDTSPRLVVNRVRGGVVSGDPRTEITSAFSRFAGIEPWWFLPDDPAGLDEALAGGRTLADVAPASPLRLAVRELAAALSGAQLPAKGRKWRPVRST